MNIYCPNCGRITPANSKICAYCGNPIPEGHKPVIAMNQPPKKKDNKILLIVVIILAVFIVGTVVIAALSYIYVSELLPPERSSSENAAVIVSASDERYFEITLAHVGDNYGNGYSDIIIYIDGSTVENINTIYPWIVGETITIGKSTTGFAVDGNALELGVYEVSVVILDTLIYNSVIEIT